jgi:UDP-N-acetylmuramoyl-L-alanyl-D-glutamate--2,6-diaminopimelate ligase
MTAMVDRMPRRFELSGLLPELEGHAEAGLSCCGAQLDSRALRAGELFIALPGGSGHGLDHLDAARAAGCAAVLVEPADLDRARERAGNLPVVGVVDLRRRLPELADACYAAAIADLALIGVTGTNGKTSCVQLIAQALNRLGTRCGTIGTLGAGFPGKLLPQLHTTPDLLQLYRALADLADAGAAAVAMEVSSHALDQQRCAGLAFHTAVFTNISRDHLDYHGTMEAYRTAKRRLFLLPGLQHAVINGDDGFGRELLATLPPGVRGWSYGLDGERDLLLSGARFDAAGVHGRLSTPWGEAPIHSPLLGRFNASNLLAAVGALGTLGVPLPAIAATLAGLTAIPGRMELLHGEGLPTVVIDYAHTPDALAAAIEATRQHCQGRLWCVFGAGGDRDRGKRPLMGRAAARADRLVVTSDNPRFEDPASIAAEIVAGVPAGVLAATVIDRREAIEQALAEAAVDDWVLIAGKGHEDYQDRQGERRPFSDRRVAEAALRQRRLQA